MLYWRLLAQLFGHEEQATLETASLAVVTDIGLPAALLDPHAPVDSIVQRHPGLAAEFDGLMTPGPDTGGARDRAAEVRRAALASKVLLNVFGTGSGPVTAGQLARWQADAGWLGRALGGNPGAELAAIEADLVRRMHLREVLADPALAARLTPSMSLIEQLLRDKGNLSGVALANAKALIRRFVNEVAEVLRTEVEKATAGELDRSVPPKRVFRNLDLDRTIWKNLTNWSPAEERLYVDRLYYRHTARKTHAPAADRRGGPVGLDDRLDGELHHPGVDLRRAAEGGRPPDRVRHAGARPHALGARPVRDPAAHPPRRRQRRHGRDGPGPAEDRRAPATPWWCGSRTSTRRGSSSSSRPWPRSTAPGPGSSRSAR